MAVTGDARMIIITGGIALKPEHRAEALRLAIEHSRRSRAEPGCLAHNCHIDCEDPNRLTFVEEWADMAVVKAHFAVPESGAFVLELTALGEGAPWMRMFEGGEVPSTV